jgi:hypothetical protein
VGRFGFHPYIPFKTWCHEVLHFIDRKRGFHLSISHPGKTTNYQMQVVEALDELDGFAVQAMFPSHALVLRPNDPEDNTVLFQGVGTRNELEMTFHESRRRSRDGRVWVQTDMRAHMNPTRMAMIQEAADTLAQRLATACPDCGAPGWGRICAQREIFSAARASTALRNDSEVNGCVLCQYTEAMTG